MSISSAIVKSSGLVRALTAKGILDNAQLEQLTAEEAQGQHHTHTCHSSSSSGHSTSIYQHSLDRLPLGMMPVMYSAPKMAMR